MTLVREWTIDLGSFTVEAETAKQATALAAEEIGSGEHQPEITDVIKGEVVTPQPTCAVGAEGCYCREEG